MFNRKPKKQLALIGLDGVSYELVKDFAANGIMPNLGKLMKSHGIVRTTAPFPEISPVSWTSMMTGMNPGEHGVFGYTELDPVTYSYRFPNFPSLPVKTLWEEFPREYTSIIVNLPHTYPVRPLNGILVSGFVAIDPVKAVYPKRILPPLEKMNYKFDPDFSLIPDKKKEFLADLNQALDIRYRFFRHITKEDWNFLVFVITETDRINHFFYHSLARGDSPFRTDFLAFYKKVDDIVGEITSRLKKKGIPFLVVSDHGFVPIKEEIYIAQYLKEWGYLHIDADNADSKDFTAMDSRSTVFALDPSRVYVHLRGKYKRGEVGEDRYNRFREELKTHFLELEVDHQKVISRVFFKEEIYWGKFIVNAPDLVLLSNYGFDLKLGLTKNSLTGVTVFEGMHSQDNAVLIDGCGFSLTDGAPIYDIGKEIKGFFNR